MVFWLTAKLLTDLTYMVRYKLKMKNNKWKIYKMYIYKLLRTKYIVINFI